MSLSSFFSILKGGAGSGNWGHSGRLGKRGGSAPKGTGTGLSGFIGGRATEININRLLNNAPAMFNNRPIDFLKENGFRVTKVGTVGQKSKTGKDPTIKTLNGGLDAFEIRSVIPKKQGGGQSILGVFKNNTFEKVPKKSLPDWELL